MTTLVQGAATVFAPLTHKISTPKNDLKWHFMSFWVIFGEWKFLRWGGPILQSHPVKVSMKWGGGGRNIQKSVHVVYGYPLISHELRRRGRYSRFLVPIIYVCNVYVKPNVRQWKLSDDRIKIISYKNYVTVSSLSKISRLLLPYIIPYPILIC